MNRLILTGTVGASTLLLADSAAKGTALLGLAAIVAMTLRRDSAATRHLVWLLAVVAMLVVPVVSPILPQWRVLPDWMAVPPQPVVEAPTGHSTTVPAEATVGLPPGIHPTEDISPTQTLPSSIVTLPAPPAPPRAPATKAPTQSQNWVDAIPVVWTVGFSVLILRLLGARWILRQTECESSAIGPTDAAGNPTRDRLWLAFDTARSQIGLHRPVTLLTHPEKAIPLVWGVLRNRLLLPESARDWDDDQLRSVLLHELAHIQRRDTLWQLLTQFACALYWFNPLVWLAAWRLGVERERACDDLVLASGVRPSAYAAHLLDIVSSLSSTRWIQPCGVAMARQSSLEGRLVAVLSRNLNRRSVSMAIGILSLAVAAGIAIPIAMLCAADKPWYSPSASHIGGNQFSTYCVHDGKKADFVVAYAGSFDSSSSNTSNAKARTWSNVATLKVLVDGEKKEIALRRDHTAPDKLTLAGKEYDLKLGRVLLVGNDGQSVRQLAIDAPAIRERTDAEKLAKQIAALPPQEREKASLKPKHESGQALFRKFQALARTDGKIPGALIGRLATQVDLFLKQVPGEEKSLALAAIRPRLDATHDWPQAEVIAIFDEITELTSAPVGWTDLQLEFAGMKDLRGGRPLPDELAKIAWGAPAENGLRAAWLLEPVEEKYALGSVLKARVLFHNTGKAPVIFSTDAWHQFDEHIARASNGNEIKVKGTWFSGITPRASFRLGPGEFCEMPGHGIAIGAGTYEEEFSTGTVGAIIEAKEGDDVRLMHTVDASQGGFTRPDDPKDPDELWKKQIAERVALQGPMPATYGDRKQLVQRVMMDLFGESPTLDEVVQFTKAEAATGLEALVTRLQERPRIKEWAGRLPTGETRFLVTAVDPHAGTRPRTAVGPGRYVLGDNVHLLVSQITTEARRENKAVIAFLTPDSKVESPHKPYQIPLPDGISTWGAVWERGAGTLWVLQKDLVRKYDFANPDAVKESRIQPGSINDIPEPLRSALIPEFDVPGAPVQQQNSQATKNNSRLPPGIEEKLQWGEPVGGLRMALVRPQALGEDPVREIFDFYLVVQNVTDSPILFDTSSEGSSSYRLLMKQRGTALAGFTNPKPTGGRFSLQAREVAKLWFPSLESKERTITAEDPAITFTAELKIENAPTGAWSGKLVSADTIWMFSAFGLAPRDKPSQSLFVTWNAIALRNAMIPGALIGQLGESVQTFIKNNPTWKTTPKLVEMLPEFDASRDWSGPEAIDLLDRLSAVQDTPIAMAAEHEWRNTVQTGRPLPASLNGAPWGKPDSTGLRLAWLLEPNRAEHRLGTPLKARVLIHNSGKKPVVFRGWSWHQAAHAAHDAKGAELKIESTEWLTLGRLQPYRLAPGEYVELSAPGVGVGANKNDDDWRNSRVGTWVDAKAGDEVTITTDPIPLGDSNEATPPAGEPGWWLDFVTARLARHRPLPADAEERKQLLYRVAMELFGTPVNEEINVAFVNDKSPAALETLAKLLAHRARMPSFTGVLQSGPTTFRVLPADPDAAKKPRIASDPGRYTVAPNVILEVTRRPVDERLKNEAQLQFFSSDPLSKSSGKPISLQLPDGDDTWAAGWVRGTPTLWVMQQGKVQRYDLTDPAEVVEATLKEQDIAETVPGDVLDALRAVLNRNPAGAVPSKAPPATRR